MIQKPVLPQRLLLMAATDCFLKKGTAAGTATRGNFAYIAVTTPADMEKFGIGWSLRLTGESGYLIALILGLFIANVLPGFARWLSDAARPELFIKTAIVILGGTLGIKAAEQLGLASSVMLRGLAAIIEAYLIYWAVVYFVARKWFGFSRE